MGEDRREYWAELIGEQERGYLSVQRFCRERGVCAASFYEWRKRLRSHEGSITFALVETTGPKQTVPSEAPLELTFANGERLRIGRGVDAATLRLALDVIRG